MGTGQNLAWWGVVLALTSLILMFPAAIFANIITPKLQNWWAQRSAASLQRRIEKLEKELADWEKNYDLLPVTEEFLLRGISIVGGLCLSILQIIPLLAWLQLYPTLVFNIGGIQARVAAAAVLFLFLVPIWLLTRKLNKKYFDKLFDYRKPRSETWRENRRKSIENLRVKLEKMS